MIAELIETLAYSPSVDNWSVGVYMVDWQPGRKYYGGLLVDGNPYNDYNDCGPHGRWFTSKRKARAYAAEVVKMLEAHDG